MKTRVLLSLGACAALSGCVLGYGPCLLQSPVVVSLTGRLHFRSYPVGSGLDHVAVLALDRTAHIYAPAESRNCLAVNDVQLTGWSEYPPDLTDNKPVTVDGSLIPATTPHQHTRFLIEVRNIEPLISPLPRKRGTAQDGTSHDQATAVRPGQTPP